MKKILLFILLFFVFGAFKPMPAYQIFSGDKSKSIDFDKMMKGLKKADVVFFGETHNNSLCHWLQLQVLKNLKEASAKEVVVGTEIFEADDQLILNEYMAGLIKEANFREEAKLWPNYNTDYAPILEFAKKNELDFIATNIPRRYASMVARNGLKSLEQLDEEAIKYIAPLPIEVNYELSSYKEVMNMMGSHMAHGKSGKNNMIDAQAIKDATMAHFISENLSDGKLMFHINGSFHSKNKEGIVYYLQKARPELNIVTITMVEQEEINELEEENQSLADYIIAIPVDMTRTY
jgi:uncharacterized iron-regulated protein